MAQVAWMPCVVCGARITSAALGRRCKACGAVFHAACAPKACPSCVSGKRPRPARRPPGPRQATTAQVVGFGVFAIAIGALIFFADPSYLVSGIRMRYLGAVAMAVGACMVLMPSLWRERVAHVVDQGWAPPPAPEVAAGQVTFEGRFSKPALLASQQPFPVKGEGRLTVGPAGIEVFGPQIRERSMLVFIPVVLLIGVVLAATFLLAYARGLPWLALLVLIPVVFLPFARKAKAEPGTVAIAWDRVRGFRSDSTRRFVDIVVGAKVGGILEILRLIRFEPKGEVADVLYALEDRGE